LELKTTSAVIGFAKKLEDDSAEFYKHVSQRYSRNDDVFLSFAKENRRNAVQVERTYFEVISDAIEGCFAFDINSDEYTFDNELTENAGYSEALDMAIRMEDTIVKFYMDATEQSKSLMADIPRAFTIIAKKRQACGLTLRSLVSKEG